MRNTKLIITMVILFVCIPPIISFIQILSAILTGASLLVSSIGIIDQHLHGGSVEEKLTAQHNAVMNMVARIDKKLENLEIMASYIKQIDTPAVMELGEFIEKLAKVFELTTKISTVYDRYKIYTNSTSHVTNNMLSEFADSVMSHDSRSPRYLVVELFRLLNDKHGVIDLVLNEEVTKYIICSRNNTSAAMFTVLMLIHVVNIELMTVSVLSYSLDYLKTLNRSEDSLRQHYIDHVSGMTQRLITLAGRIRQQPKEKIGRLWRCDSTISRIGRSEGLQFSFFLQSVYVCLKKHRTSCPEYLIGTDGSAGDVEDCLPSDKSYRNTCLGQLITCETVQTNEPLSFSEASRGNEHYRRFDKICVPGITSSDCSIKIDKTGVTHCICVCDAFSDHKSIRSINTGIAVSRIELNRVITGVRFKMSSQMLSLEVRDTQVSKNGTLVGINDWFLPNDGTVVNNVRLTAQQRRFNLNTLVGGPGYYVTGVGLQSSIDGFHLQIQITQYDKKTHRLVGPSRIVNPYYLKSNAKIGTSNKMPPTSTTATFNTYVFEDSFVEFAHSSFEKDSGQTTVPFFDAREVVSPLPLEGIGIFYKVARSEYAGYITPVLIPIDLSKKITDMAQLNFNKLLPMVIPNGTVDYSGTCTLMDYYSRLLMILVCITTFLTWR